METLSSNTLSPSSSDSIRILESVYQKLLDTLMRNSWSKEDIKAVKDLKGELITCINDIIEHAMSDKNFPKEVKVDDFWFLHTMKLTSHTNLALVMHAYQSLKAEYIDKLWSKRWTIATTKQSLSDILSDENDDESYDDELNLDTFKTEKNADARSSNEKIDTESDASFWTEISELLHIDDLSDENCYDIFNDFDWDAYSEQELSDLSVSLKKNSRTTKFSKDVKKFVAYLSKHLKNFLDTHVVRLTKEDQRKMAEQATILFVSGIRYFDEFVNRANDAITHDLDLSRFGSFEALQKTPAQYRKFLTLRQEFNAQYTAQLSDRFENLFKSDHSLDNFFYTNILARMKDLWTMYSSSKMSDKQFFVWAKKWFLLGDIYEFLQKNVGNDMIDDVVFSPFLTQELKKYSGA